MSEHPNPQECDDGGCCGDEPVNSCRGEIQILTDCQLEWGFVGHRGWLVRTNQARDEIISVLDSSGPTSEFPRRVTLPIGNPLYLSLIICCEPLEPDPPVVEGPGPDPDPEPPIP
jgi:hypothetical protein